MTTTNYLSDEEIVNLLANFTPEERKDYIQQKVFNCWKQSNYRGTFEGATGVGKTKVGVLAVVAELMVNPSAVIYIVVPTTELRDKDWPDEFIRWGYGDLLGQINIICFASISKVKPKADVDLLIVDEIHHWTESSAQFYQATNEWKIFHILGLTATLPKVGKNDDEKVKLLRINQMAPSIFKVPLEQAIQLELVADFEIKVLKFELDMKTQNVLSGSKDKPFWTTEYAAYKYLTKMVQKFAIIKREGAKFAWIGKRTRFLRNLESKKRLAKECMQGMLKQGKRTLIFGGSIEQIEALCAPHTYHSQTTDQQLIAFQAKEIDYCGVVDALNEGKNINELDQILVVQLNASERRIIQRIGRTIRFRLGHKALVVILVAKDTADEQWCESALENFDTSRITYYNVSVPAA